MNYYYIHTLRQVCPGDIAVMVLDLATPKVAGSIPGLALSGNNVGKLFTHMCLCHQTVQYDTGQGR